MFIVDLNYILPEEAVAAARPAHIEFLDKWYGEGKFLMSGRKYDGTGGIIVVNSDSQDEVNKIMQQDPFYLKKVAGYNIVGFNVTKTSILHFVENN